jgi:tetraacyldisaccharide 4'-kinase
VASTSSGVHAAFSRLWRRRGPAAWLLLPVSLLFGLLTGLRRQLYRSGLKRAERLPVPVLVVGNIFVGGTGKTPFTIWLAQQLRAAGFHPGVISRGYGASVDVPRLVSADASPDEVGDEPLLIARHGGCPMAVGRNRAAAGRALLAAHPDIDVVLLDDGLQHYALARDLEIMLFDGRGAGNGWLLPAGPLREPRSRRRDVTVVNGGTAAGMPAGAFAMQLRGQWAVNLARPDLRMPLSDLAARQPAPKILAAAGIGNPERYFAMLEGEGLRFERMPLPDHYAFTENPFAGSDADVILITEKDAVKCRHSDALRNDARLWFVPVEAVIDAALADYIVEKLRGFPTDRHPGLPHLQTRPGL